jgi:hypothetical protein
MTPEKFVGEWCSVLRGDEVAITCGGPARQCRRIEMRGSANCKPHNAKVPRSDRPKLYANSNDLCANSNGLMAIGT